MQKWKDKIVNLDDKKKLFKNSSAYTLLALAVLAMVFFGICSPQDFNSGSISGPAAKVAGEKVTLQEFQRAYSMLEQRMQRQYREAWDPKLMALAPMVMKQIVDERITYQVAKKSGLEARDDDVVRLLQDAKAFHDEKGNFSAEAYKRYLKSNGYNEASFTAELKRSLTVQSFREFVSSTTYVSQKSAELENRLNDSKIDVEFIKLDPSMITVNVTDEEVKTFLDEAGKGKVKAYFDSNASEFNTKEQVRARHILFSFSGARDATGASALRSKEDARKKAEETLSQARKSGAQFASLATAMTDEASGKSRGGDLGFFTKEDMVKEFSDVAFSLKPGEVSGIVESPFGFHIIKVEEHKAAKVTTLEEATALIAKKLIKETKSPELLSQEANAVLADLKSSKPIEARLSSLKTKWETTGPTSLGSGSFGPLGSDPSVVQAISALSSPGQLVDTVLTSGNSRFIARLKSSQINTTPSSDSKKIKELSETASSSIGYSMLTGYDRMFRKDLEKNGKIWENPAYLKIGQDQGQSGS
jgi:peptidyl-prolyl cis-trans isomerase D